MIPPVTTSDIMEVDELPPESHSHHSTRDQATNPRKAFETCPNQEAKRKKYDPNFVVLALPCQTSRRAVKPSRVTATFEKEATTTRKVQNTGPNSADKSKDFDPNFVVLALPCQYSRKAATPGRVAAEVSSVRTKDSIWFPPPPGVYKINFHGFSFSELGDVGIGIVVRDCRGDLIAAMSRKLKYGSFTQSIEALTISFALRFGHDLGLPRVFMEGDFAMLGTGPYSEAAADDKETVEKYEFCKFSYVKEEANLVAHKLACYAVRVEDFIVWMEDTPDFLMNTLALDSRPIKKRNTM